MTIVEIHVVRDKGAERLFDERFCTGNGDLQWSLHHSNARLRKLPTIRRLVVPSVHGKDFPVIVVLRGGGQRFQTMR